jgi:RNA-directed DNA polymerase
LKACIFDDDNLYISNEGVPQGGIISPLIANFTLNGIEQATDRNTIKSILSSKFENRKGKSSFEIKTHLIRYADEFLIITNSNKYFKFYIKNVKFFLEIRGLKINEDKTKIIAMDNNSGVSSFNFLGYTFYKFRSPHHSKIFTR